MYHLYGSLFKLFNYLLNLPFHTLKFVFVSALVLYALLHGVVSVTLNSQKARASCMLNLKVVD